MSKPSGRHHNRPSLEDKDYARSSFFRAFYAGPNQTPLDDLSGGSSTNSEEKPAAAAVGPHALNRGASRRQMTPAARRASSLTKRAINVPAAVREESGGPMSDHTDITSLIPPSLDREESWVVDMRMQQASMEADGNGVASAHASAGMGDGSGAAMARGLSDGGDNHGFGDMEVREQFRILAQHEAATRVRENMGFDPLSDPRSKKMIDASKDDTMRSTRHSLPKPGKPPMRDVRPRHVARPRAPPSAPPPREYKRDPASVIGGPRVPELCPGVLVNDDADRGTMNEDEHLVRCLGCKRFLKVKKLATLVSCPDCQTVSPASSTRR